MTLSSAYIYSKGSIVKSFMIYLTAGRNSELDGLPLKVGSRASEIN